MIKIFLYLFLFTTIYANDIIRYTTNAPIDLLDAKNILELNNYQVESTSKLEKSFEQFFNDDRFEVYRVLAVYEKNLTKKLLLKYPDFSAITPYSIGFIKYKNSDTTNIVFLSSQAIKKVLNITTNEPLIDEIVNKNIEIAKLLQSHTKPQSFEYIPSKTDKGLIYKKTIKGNAEKIAQLLEDKMEKQDFKYINYMYLKDVYNEIDNEYNFFTIASLCKKKVLHYVSPKKPEAIVFAPCSLSIYQKKGSENTTIVFPTIYNWISTLDITDITAIKSLINEQEIIEKLLEEVEKEIN